MSPNPTRRHALSSRLRTGICCASAGVLVAMMGWGIPARAAEPPEKPAANRPRIELPFLTSESEDSSSQTSLDPTDAPSVPKPPWDYSLGGTFKSSDLAKLPGSAGLEPVVGLRYGRWKLGIGDGSEWLRFNSFRKDESLDYKWLDTRRYSLSLSMQFHTLTAGEGSDAPEVGQRTLRGRAIGSIAITRRWSAGLAWTQDLLGKGDSSTLGFGVSYAWPVDTESEMILNGGLTWGTAEHWRNAYGPHRVGAETLRTGIDSWGLGLNYKHKLARHWAWFASLSFSGDVGPLGQLPGTHSGRAGQVGLLYFHR